MYCDFIGGQVVQFTANNGDEIKGMNIYTAYEAPNVVGKKADKFFIKDDFPFPENAKVGDILNVDFSPTGRILSVELVIKK